MTSAFPSAVALNGNEKIMYDCETYGQTHTITGQPEEFGTADLDGWVAHRSSEPTMIHLVTPDGGAVLTVEAAQRAVAMLQDLIAEATSDL